MEIVLGDVQVSVSGFFLLTAVLVLLFLVRLLTRKSSLKTKLNLHRDSQGRKVIPYTLGETPNLPKGKQSVVIIDVRGPIMTSGSGLSPMAARYVTLGVEMGTMLRELADNDLVSGAIVRMSTPGGTVVGSEELRDGMIAFGAKKPILAFVEDMSASGGVMAMVGATEIMAHPSSLIGSIGVLGPRLMRYESVTAYGRGILGEHVEGSVTGRVLFAGAGKALGDPFTPYDERAISSFQRVLDRTYERFVDSVATMRKMPSDVLKNLGASIVDGSEALRLRLIDSLGTEEHAVQRICDLIGVDRKEANLVSIKPKLSSRFSLLFGAAADLGLVPQARIEIAQRLQADPVLLCSSDHLKSFSTER